MNAQLSASINVFGDDVQVSADAHRSKYDNEWIVTFRVDRLHVGVDVPTARALVEQLTATLVEIDQAEAAS